MGMMKHLLESVALREFGVVDEDTLDQALPIAQAEIDELKKELYSTDRRNSDRYLEDDWRKER